MLRIAPRMIVTLLCGSMLAGCASMSGDVAKLTGGDTQAGHAKKEEAAAVDKNMPTDLEGGVRQAQLMRLSGHYDDAIHVLSQLMLVASDDPRVVAEYGKTLAEKGRAQDAVEFLGRAIELSSNDWTLYSALGVSYDQLGNQTGARAAYEHALALHPEEPSVLNNYALSRMLAGDTDGAHQLIGRAQLAGGASDAKIASNIALLNKLAPIDVKQNVAAARPVQPVLAANAPQAIPRQVPQQRPLAQNMPRAIVPNMPYQPQQLANNAVVMQAVPFDPYAGPVKPASHAPRHLTAPAPASVAAAAPQAASIKPAPAKAATAAPKQVTASAKPAAAPVKTADAKPDVKLDIKAAAVKPIPVKAAGKDAIPALRMSANSY